MNQRTKRELEFAVSLVRLTSRDRHKANTALQRLRDNRTDIIITRNLSRRADEFMAATGQRLYVRQIARGVYRQISDEHGQAKPLGILLAAVLTLLASAWLINLAVFFMAAAPASIAAFFPAITIVCLLIYAYVWLVVGAQAVQRIRRQTA